MKNLIFHLKSITTKYAPVLVALCFAMSSQAQQIEIEGTDLATDAIKISGQFYRGVTINGGTEGINIEFVDGEAINIDNPKGHGIYCVGAGAHAGLFNNLPNTTLAALYARHGSEVQHDLYLGGTGWVGADASFNINIDKDDDGANDFFAVRTANGDSKLYVYESGDGGVTGNFSKGGGSFKIDHPLDPANQYLYHSFVESPDMMNVYNGNVVLDAQGLATVQMADWFEALNRDFRYQLTPLGAPGPNLHIAHEMREGSFQIAGGVPGMQVSWQVTGIRHDPFANENRIEVEVLKEAQNQGKYIHPTEWAKATGVTKLESVTLESKQLVPSPNADATKLDPGVQQEISTAGNQ